MEIWLDKETADELNKIGELFYGDSAHCPRKFCLGEEIALTKITELIISNFYEKKNREAILHCPEEEFRPKVAPIFLVEIQAMLATQPESLKRQLYFWLKQFEFEK